MEPTVISDKRDHTLWLRLNRPDVLNAINDDMIDQLDTGLRSAENDPDVRVIVITGTGRAFCAGADLGHVPDDDTHRANAESHSGHQHAMAFLRRVRDLFRLIEEHPKPVIAAVNGIALGGGFELMLCADLVVVDNNASVGDGHAKYGIVPGGGSSARLPRRVGLVHAKRLMFTGNTLRGEQLVQLGLANESVEPDKLDTTTQELADELAARSPLALRRVKALVNASIDQPLEQALDAELLVSELHRHSSDSREGLSAFKAKRMPDFSGR